MPFPHKEKMIKRKGRGGTGRKVDVHNRGPAGVKSFRLIQLFTWGVGKRTGERGNTLELGAADRG